MATNAVRASSGIKAAGSYECECICFENHSKANAFTLNANKGDFQNSFWFAGFPTWFAGMFEFSTLSHEKLQTEFRASISLASETAAFLDPLNGHDYSIEFVKGHLLYLKRRGLEIQDDLKAASTDDRDTSSLSLLRVTTGELTQILDELQKDNFVQPTSNDSRESLRSISQRLVDGMHR